jgi:hypothetical protein
VGAAGASMLEVYYRFLPATGAEMK